MNLHYKKLSGTTVAIVACEAPCILTTGDALDLMATASHEGGASAIVLPKSALCEEFFDLRTGLAGEILQKYVNYGMRLAVVGDFSGYESKALRDFIRESNRGAQIFFLGSEEEALEKLRSLD